MDDIRTPVRILIGGVVIALVAAFLTPPTLGAVALSWMLT